MVLSGPPVARSSRVTHHACWIYLLGSCPRDRDKPDCLSPYSLTASLPLSQSHYALGRASVHPNPLFVTLELKTSSMFDVSTFTTFLKYGTVSQNTVFVFLSWVYLKLVHLQIMQPTERNGPPFFLGMWHMKVPEMKRNIPCIHPFVPFLLPSLILFLRLKSSSYSFHCLLKSFPLPPSRCCLLKFYNRPRSERASEQASEVRLGLNVHQFRKSPLFCSPACLPACPVSWSICRRFLGG